MSTRRDPPRRLLAAIAVGLPVCVVLWAVVKYFVEVMR